MSLQIVPFEKNHLEPAAELFIQNYSQARKYHPLLPERYEHKENIIPKLSWISENCCAFSALSKGRLVGYISGIVVPEFKSSRKGIYTPEWGHSVIDQGEENIYDALFNEIYQKCRKDKCSIHALTLFENDKVLTHRLFWKGYGMLVVDAVRSARALDISSNEEILIRKADEHDFEQLTTLLREHEEYMISPPIFLQVQTSVSDIAHMLEEWFLDPGKTIWVAERNGEILGLMNSVVASDNACEIVQDDKVLGIQHTHIKESARGQGIAKLLLNRVNQWAAEHGFEALSVDFESANFLGGTFWMNYFEPVCYSLARSFDDRTLD